MTIQTRAVINRMKHKWRTKVAPALPKVWQAVVVPLAWGLLTWSVVGWMPRAWAASIGLLLMASIGIKLRITYLLAKAHAKRDQ
jgi:hypothetical protein